ncbi:MAG: hypothetical protein K2P81_02280 [Bacteriovoracaceae bacterium]|nr:hypothetical protein [Bacteriovoracaceae bacterium]
MKLFASLVILLVSMNVKAERLHVMSKSDFNYVLVKATFEASPNGSAWINADFNTSSNENSDGNWRDSQTAQVAGLYLDRTSNEIRYESTVCAKVFPRRWGTPIVKNTGNCKLEAVRAREQDPNDWYGRSRRVWQIWLTVP